jgi:hypothetical protein
MNEPLKVVLNLIFLVLCIALACVVIRDGSQIIANAGAHVMKLFG